MMAYHIPPGNTPDNYAAQELAVILGQGQSSRMYQHLVKDKQLASQVAVFADARIGPSLLYISATARPGVKAEDLEKGNRRRDRGRCEEWRDRRRAGQGQNAAPAALHRTAAIVSEYREPDRPGRRVL